jgi:hypothetical protein
VTLPYPKYWRIFRLSKTEFTVVEETKSGLVFLADFLRTIPLSGKQIHDANLVATMLTYNIPNLLTNNVEDFKRFSHLITVLPLGASIS